jgi:hypothetical protein
MKEIPHGEIQPSQKRLAVTNSMFGVGIQQQPRFFGKTEVADQLDPRATKIDGVVSADADIEAAADTMAKAIESRVLPMNQLCA